MEMDTFSFEKKLSSSNLKSKESVEARSKLIGSLTEVISNFKEEVFK